MTILSTSHHYLLLDKNKDLSLHVLGKYDNYKVDFLSAPVSGLHVDTAYTANIYEEQSRLTDGNTPALRP